MTNLHNFHMHFHLEHAPWRGTPPCKRRPWTCGWVASDFEPCKFAGYAYPASSWTQRPSLKRIHVFPFFTWQWNIQKSKVAKLASRDWRYTPRKLNPRRWSQQRARTNSIQPILGASHWVTMCHRKFQSIALGATRVHTTSAKLSGVDGRMGTA